MDNQDRSKLRLARIEVCGRLACQFGMKEKAYRHRFALTNGMVSRDKDAFARTINARGGAQVVVKERGKLVIAEDVALPATRGPIHRAEPALSTLREIIQAIVDKRAVRFRYRRCLGNRSDRPISPHTIVHAVGRFHVRGWDYGRNAPRDSCSRVSRPSCERRHCKGMSVRNTTANRTTRVPEVRLREGERLDAAGPTTTSALRLQHAASTQGACRLCR